MRELLRDWLGELSGTFGPSGDEDEVRARLRELLEPLVDRCAVDRLGNLTGTRQGAGERSLLIAAHMDEVGVVVTHIDDDGFCRLAPVGDMKAPSLLGQQLRFANGTVGAVGSEHLKDDEELTMERLYVDVGAASAEAARRLVAVGDTAVFHRSLTDLDGDRVVGKALDNRLGCAVLLTALSLLGESPHTIYAVFTVQEEVGSRGARPVAYALEPDVGLAVDVTPTGDTPKARQLNVRLGKGAAIKIKDASLVAHPAVRDLLVDHAEAEAIPYQLEVLPFGGTDAGSIQLSRSGVPSGAISLPIRHIHTAAEVADLKDAEAAVRLLTTFMSRPIPL